MFVKSPTIFKILYPQLIWDIKTKENEIFLTFDDGPDPTITPWVIDTLKEYNALATFFCVGENVCIFPDTYNLILANGHSVGNHTYNHLNGWKTNNKTYYENIKNTEKLVDSKLFRPPYGRIKFSQIKKIKRDYSIIMWTVLTYDFDHSIDGDICYRNSIRSSKPGTIIVFHDSVKAEKNLKYALPLFLEYFKNKGYKFSALPMSQFNKAINQ